MSIRSVSRMSTDAGMMETISYEMPDFPMQYRQISLEIFPNREISWHWHQEVEFALVEEGVLNCSVNNFESVLKKGDGIFINGGKSHRFYPAVNEEETAKIRCILFSSSFVFGKSSRIYKQYIQPITAREEYQYLILQRECDWQKRILEELEALIGAWEERGEDCYMPILRSVCNIWDLLYRHRTEIPVRDLQQVLVPSQMRMQQMVSFIQAHYMDPITLADIAKAAHISQSEAARCFKKHLGSAPVNFLNSYRLEVAREKLQSSELTVTDIAMQCGFESVSYFDRVFRKKYWVTPLEFKNNMNYLD